MKILVTGAAGFIGSHLCRELVLRGDDVTGYDNFHEYYPRRCKEFNVDLINLSADSKKAQFFPYEEIQVIHEQLSKYDDQEYLKNRSGKFEFIEGDVTDFETLKSLFKNKKFDVVVHLAAMAGVPYSIKEPRLYTTVNIDGTVNLLNLSVENKVSNFIFASSSSVYGNTKEVPFSENKVENKTISPYAATKLAGEILCHTFHYNFGLPITCLRFFTVYGPLQRPYGMVIQRFINQALHDLPLTVYGNGMMARDYTYFSDTVSGIIASIDKKLDFEILNLGNSSPVKLNALVEEIEKALNKKVKVDHLDRPSTEVDITYADISKANKILGYQPKIGISEGIKRQVEVLMMMPKWYRDMENV